MHIGRDRIACFRMLRVILPLILSIVSGNSCIDGANCDARDGTLPHTDVEDETVLLQALGEIKRQAGLQAHAAQHDSKSSSCKVEYSPGIHYVQLPELQRQFLFVVPREVAQGVKGAPLVMHFHGMRNSPWYDIRYTALPTYLESYGWLGIVPFGLDANMSNGMSGMESCCAAACDEHCCKNGLMQDPDYDTACRWDQVAENAAFTKALIEWAAENACVDPQKVFATGFSVGGQFVGWLGCEYSELFIGMASMSGDRYPDLFCLPKHPFSYISICGSLDDASQVSCNSTWPYSVDGWSRVLGCTGDGPGGAPINETKSATTSCQSWNSCKGGNFLEMCMNAGMDHRISGHMSPADTIDLRPASDLDIVEYIFQKFSALVGGTLLFYGRPTQSEIDAKHDADGMWRDIKRFDHMYLREELTGSYMD